MKKVYISNICSRVWPVAKQEKLIAEHVPEWPDVSTYRDEISAAKRRGQSREAMTQRRFLLQPATPRPETIMFASWPVLAWDQRDLGECWAAAKERGAVLMALDTGATLAPDSGANEWLAVSADFLAKKKSADAGGGSMVGARASVKARTEDTAKRIDLIRADWPMPEPPTSELLDRAGRYVRIGKRRVWKPMAYQTASKKEHLGPRPKAQAALQANLARANANRRRRKSGKGDNEDA